MLLIALMIFSVRFSARLLFNDNTAQIAAGIQPNNVNCNTRHKSPEKTLPLKMNDNQGRKIAIKIIKSIFSKFT